MLRTVIAPLAAVAALAFTACGSDDNGRRSHGCAGGRQDQDRAGRARAARGRARARTTRAEQGLAASLSNAGTAVKDRQIVALFVLDDAGVAGEIAEQVRASAPSRRSSSSTTR